MKTIRWDGRSADYDENELREMAALRRAGDVAALRLIHQLKSRFDATLLYERTGVRAITGAAAEPEPDDLEPVEYRQPQPSLFA